MPITGKIKTLFADNAKTQALFPRTVTSAITNDAGVSLDTLLEAAADSASLKDYVDEKLASFSSCPFVVSTSAPSNTNLLWIDTDTTTGGLKYHDGSTWVHVPVAYTV